MTFVNVTAVILKSAAGHLQMGSKIHADSTWLKYGCCASFVAIFLVGKSCGILDISISEKFTIPE